MGDKTVIDISSLLAGAVGDICCCEAEPVLMTVDDDDSLSEADMDLENDMNLINVELGEDLSMNLGKDFSKQPKFGRFCYQPVDIAAAVQEMRENAIMKKESRSRSWASSFRFTGRSSKQPRFERF